MDSWDFAALFIGLALGSFLYGAISEAIRIAWRAFRPPMPRVGQVWEFDGGEITYMVTEVHRFGDVGFRVYCGAPIHDEDGDAVADFDQDCWPPVGGRLV